MKGKILSINRNEILAAELAALDLNAASLPDYYRKIMALRFPMDVADVIDVRATLNHAIDQHNALNPAPGYYQFLDAITAAISSFGVSSHHHQHRFRKLLGFIRELHQSHLTRSKKRELQLRRLMRENRDARLRSIRLGLFSFIMALVASLTWITQPESTWIIKFSTGILSYMALDFFMSIGTLDREHQILTQEVNDLLRRRIQSINWKTLIHKLGLLMGYKKVSGLEVFLLGDQKKHTLPLYH